MIPNYLVEFLCIAVSNPIEDEFIYVALCNSGQYFTKHNVFLRVILNKQTAKFIQKYFSSNCINIALMHSAQSAFPS